MPSVLGQRLDTALSDIKRAGITEEVEILGGGVLGVIDKSNWLVCEQEPAVGKSVAEAPRLKVDRSCSGGSPDVVAPSSTPTAQAQASSAPPGTPSVSLTPTQDAPSDKPLTTTTSAAFAALVPLDYCSADISSFAADHAGQLIQFEGSIGAMNPHGNAKTRYDILLNFGDDGRGTTGPNFQFRDVNTVHDLHLTGPNIPDTIGVGANLRVTARVDRYEEQSCLLLLEPVSTEFR